MKYTLKELRARKDMTQAEIAKAFNVSTQTYGAWEKDFGMVKVRDASMIAEFHNVNLDEIFFRPTIDEK